ncbi:trace amine-associated receptor 1-like [Paramacrobiotus metropolitanus]|uniref:trace amine-associated receptor 1-like n=1 Tax=Paramacrobiotus metropolitanus TaxID=2943436 RepID=UPI00244580BB|nr:trace amine-associated receptor 1-like [Paramacrobiotus metropolitanus]
MSPNESSTNPTSHTHNHSDGPCSQDAHLVSMYALLTFPIAAVMTNVAFCIAVLGTKNLRTIPNLFLVSDAVSDFVLGGVMMPLRIVLYVQDDCWSFGHLACKLYLSSTEYFSAVSLAHAAAVAIERHVRLFRPHVHKKWRERIWFPILGIVIVWLYPALFTYVTTFLPSVLGGYPYDKHDSGDGHTDTDICRQLHNEYACNCLLCYTDAINLIDVTGQSIIPLFVVFGIYGHIIYVAHQRIRLAGRIRRHLESQSSTGSAPCSDVTPVTDNLAKAPYIHRLLQSAEFRSIRLFLVILLALFICVMPSIANHFALLIWAEESMRELQSIVASGRHVITSNANISYGSLRFAIPFVLWSHSLVNPLLLFLLNKNYRGALCAIFLQIYLKF